MASPRNTNDQTRTLLLIAGIVAVVAIIGVIVAVVVGGGDDGEDATESTTNCDQAAVSPAPAAAALPELPPFPADNIYKPVVTEGSPLPALTPGADPASDPAAGCLPAPIVRGYDYAGNETTIDPAADGPTMIVLLAHWCPHCNAEIPRLNEWRDSGEVPEGLKIVGVSTGVSADAPNFPPDQWLVDKDWQWPVLADDASASAMNAYGGTSYPTMVLVDGNGVVFRRLSGEVPIEEIDRHVDELVGSSAAQTTG